MQYLQNNILLPFTNLVYKYTTKKNKNIAFHVNDAENNIIKNHQLLAKELGYNLKTLVHMKQIHSSLVHVVDEYDNFDNPPTCDALITDKKNIPLMVMVADCSPILFYDKEKKIIAVAHAGRVGVFKNIVKNVIECFVNNYNSNTKNILVSIGTSIGVCCYEVGSEIYDETKKLNIDYSIQRRDKSYYLDIRKILKKQLLELDINENNIDISKECSCCNSNTYFSYRANPITGRFAGIIMLK